MKLSKSWHNFACTIYNKELQSYISTGKKHSVIVRTHLQSNEKIEVSETCEHCKIGYYKVIDIQEN
jgi:hypothetical protein